VCHRAKSTKAKSDKSDQERSLESVILDPEQLRPLARSEDGGSASERLKPYDARLMRCYPLSTPINHVDNGGEECSAPVELGQIQDRPFSQLDCEAI
jgi:hypothetical protein